MGPHARHRTREQLDAALTRLPEPIRVTVAVEVATYLPARGSGAGRVTVG
jgi:23S rRNA (guanine745-N1)-methyltransferase